ncbi:MAG: hypothetical protein U0Q19_06000 [Kineosporiaceae bacterium]
MKPTRARILPGIVLAATTLVLVVALVIAARWPGPGVDLVTVNPRPVAEPSPTSSVPPRPTPSVDAVATSAPSGTGGAAPDPRRTTPRRVSGAHRTPALHTPSATRPAEPPPPTQPAPEPTRQPPADPERSVLTVTSTGTNASGGYAVLAIGNVVPNLGGLASITVLGGPAAVSVPTAGPYGATIAGLPLGRAYALWARVCNTGGRCSDSSAVSVTVLPPAPNAGIVSITWAGSGVYVLWGAVANPTANTMCTVRLERGGISLASVPQGLAAGATLFAWAGSGGYQAVKTCTWEGGTVEARSSVLTL